MDAWMADKIIQMRENRITQVDISRKSGKTREAVNRILNGKVTKASSREWVTKAIDEIIAERS